MIVIKSQSEIERMRVACAAAAEILAAVAAVVEPGRTTFALVLPLAQSEPEPFPRENVAREPARLQ